MKNVYFGILAGGLGERLWPLSKKDRPKQLIPFLNDKSLLEQTIDRLKQVTLHQENIFIITSKEQSKLVKDAVGSKVGFIVEEPAGRNTGPAILLGCHEIYKKNQEAVIVFLPADHFIPQVDKFCKVIKQAINYVSLHDKIATLGLMPTSPATGYGYIQAVLDRKKTGTNGYKVTKFHEKPDYTLAQEYLAREDMFWNVGIFTSKAFVFIKEFELCSPGLFFDMQKYLHNNLSYNSIEKISVDYAVMEKSKNMVVFPADFEWNDVGNLDIFLQLQAKYSKKSSYTINIDAHDNLVSTSKKIVACVGVSNICIVETEDSLLIVRRDRAEDVKKVASKISEISF